ncbi:rap gtpase-activating protein [Anaeramoeba flamelloides]|uniref:Rap gtpase-activating protein n=1 Tax=Anaeramoeba flamelloides TaxID=1746091 RepID=A0ABQ8XL81_9EUKA|nr:rap gtpase-activating protein [Anaeramoeba flamelloides]
MRNTKNKKIIIETDSDECSISNLDEVWASDDDWVEVIPFEYKQPTLFIEQTAWIIESFKQTSYNLNCFKDEVSYRNIFYNKDEGFNLCVHTKDDQYHLFCILETEDENGEITIERHSVDGSELKVFQRSEIKLPFMKKLFCRTNTDDVYLTLFDPELKNEEFTYCNHKDDQNDILDLTEYQKRKKYKIGVLYVKEGQTKEEQFLHNVESSKTFQDFLNIIGDKVKLSGFEGFSGGLDLLHGSCGKESVYTEWNDFEIMFHVSTLLPYDKSNKQQVVRKKHIGNDVVMIVFLDGNVKFDPDSFVTRQIHVIIAIRPIFKWGELKYRIEVSRRSCVPEFEPILPTPPIFDKNTLRDYLLTKVCQAERNVLVSGQFLKRYKFMRKDIIQKIYKRNLF